MTSPIPASTITRPDLLIGGRAVTPVSRLPVENPAHPLAVVGEAPVASAEQARAAVESARAAGAAWSAVAVEERAALLRRAAEVCVADADVLARLLTREQGKILAESSAEFRLFAETFRATAGLAETLHDQRQETDRGSIVLHRRPRGVVAAIVPWNWPVMLFAAKVAPALLAGNTVVVKAPDETPLALYEVAHRVAALFPPGVLNVISGPVSDLGPVLTGDAAVRMVSFTGSIASGRRVMAESASGMKAVVFELGGNDPALILDDAVLDDKAVTKLLASTFATSGQGCQLAKRIFVHRSRHDELVRSMITLADRRYVVGDGLDPAVTMGPHASRRQAERVRQMVEEARAAGATVRPCGRAADEAVFAAGHFMLPTIITGAPLQSRIVVEEQFGAAVPIIPFDDDDHAIALANDTEYGLCASVWTANEDRYWSVARRVEAGTVLWNHHNVLSVWGLAPYGGMKQSGNGREGGFDGIAELTELQVLTTRKG